MKALLLLAAASLLPAAEPTFYRDIAPITTQYCVQCHRPGEAGPFSLITYQDVKKRASQIAAVTKARYMPPWLPEPGYGHFAEERRLTDTQIHTIAAWVKAGMPEGSPADAPPTPHFTPGWQLGPPDLIIQATQAHLLRADGPDQFWNFVLRSPVPGTRYVRAIEIHPGNTTIVHHANLLVDRTQSSRALEPSAGTGFEGMDLSIEADTFDPDSHFLFWKPGSPPYFEPAGMAWRLDKNNDLVLNMHLRTTGKPETVQPSVGLYFTDKPQTKFPMLLQLEHDGALHVPPGNKDYLVTDDFQLPLDVDVLAVYPHAHYIGKLLEAYATLPDGRRVPLIRIPDWDLNWQAVYHYAEPVFLPKGTVLSMRFHYDNSATNPRNPNQPPKQISAGNQATDEMGHLWLQVLPRGDDDHRDVLQAALMRHRLEKYPTDFSAQFNLGALLLSHNTAKAAIPYFQAALRMEPDHVAALNALGAALMATGDTAAAQVQFEHTLRLQPAYTNARYNLANLQADDGRLEEAIANFRQVIQEIPDDATVREHLFLTLKAWTGDLASKGQWDRAVQALHEAQAMHPDDPELQNIAVEARRRP